MPYIKRLSKYSYPRKPVLSQKSPGSAPVTFTLTFHPNFHPNIWVFANLLIFIWYYFEGGIKIVCADKYLL